MAQIDRPYDASYYWCVVATCLYCTISWISYYQTHFTPYVTACKLEQSFIFEKQLQLKATDDF